MDPVEIDAGRYYLRQLRADDHIGDRPALVHAFPDLELRRFVKPRTLGGKAPAPAIHSISDVDHPRE